jgi:O-antigen/teichoic acid export membrane protein
VLTVPVQHWIIRSSHTGAGLAAVRRVLPRVTGAVLALAGVVAVISWLAREQVFTSDDVAFPIMAAALTVGAFVVGVVRGRLAGVQRFVATGVAIAAENVLRVLLAVIVVWRAGGAVGFGLALSAGGLAVLAWPSAFRFPGPAAGGERASPTAQLVLTGGPVVLATIGGGAAEITALFAALALFRAPYLLALGLVTQVTGAFTDLIVGGRHDMVRRIRRLVVGGGVLAAGAAWLFGLTVGPELIRLVFGADVSPAAPIVALVAAATTVGLANLVFTVLLVARGSSGQLTTNWVAAVGVAAAVILASPLPPLPLVAWAFLAAEVTAFVLMWLGEVRAHRAWATAATADRERSPTP